MYRSISTNRFSDDQYNNSYYSSSSPSAKVPTALRALTSSQQQEMLPMYEPMSEAAKKDKIRSNFAEKAVHAIPFVLLICAFILWIASNSGQYVYLSFFSNWFSIYTVLLISFICSTFDVSFYVLYCGWNDM